MKTLLIIDNSVDGHTIKICDTIAHTLQDQYTVMRSSLDETDQALLEQADIIVIGASIRYGKHRPALYTFISNYQQLLTTKPFAFFNVNLVARKPEKSSPATNSYMQKFLQQSAVKPNLLEVFAGKLNYPIYGYLDKTMIRFIMWITKGPTDLTTVQEFTDWKKVEKFAEQLNQL